VEPTGEGVRVDTGIREGAEISIYYDPMISKLVTHGKDRAEALERMRVALDSYVIRGVTHNVNFLRSITDHPRFIEGRITTNFIPEEYPDGYKGHELSLDEKHTLISAALLVKSRFFQARTTISNKIESYNPSSHHFNSIKENTAAIGNELYLVNLVNHDINPESQSLTVNISRLQDKEKGKPINLSKTLDSPVSIKISSLFKRGDIVFDVKSMEVNIHYSLLKLEIQVLFISFNIWEPPLVSI